MARILISGKSCELSREAFSRAARHVDASSQPTRRAVFHSGTQPDSAAGGPRALKSEEIPHKHPSFEFPCANAPEHPQPLLGGERELWAIALTLFAASFAVLLLALGVVL